MLGEQDITISSAAPGSWVAGDWQEGSASTRTIKGAIQPLTGRELEQLPEQWRTRARWKLYSRERLKTVDLYAGKSADRVQWSDPSVGTLALLVVGMSDFSNTPKGMTLRHFKYALIEQAVSDAAR